MDVANSTIGLTLTSPVNNTTYRITSDLDLSAQQVAVSALTDTDLTQLTFFVDGLEIVSFSSPPFQTWWTLSVGVHRFWAEGLAVNGELLRSSEVTITVE